MKEYISQQSKLKLQILGIYQILGGLTGIALNIWGFFSQFPIFGIQIIFPLIFFILYTYSIFCGNKCLRLDENALTYSLYNQMLQMLTVSIFGFSFKYLAGFYLNVVVDFTSSINLKLDTGLPGFGIFYNRDPHTMIIGINLIAIALVFGIDWLMKVTKREKEAFYLVKD